ncbi:uncharacterized protein C14orf119 homolog isoform X1 [Trichogramma pretiosum]|uniref:Uncharacterized protein n=1 Tax=Trichogramma kaykai TaxID=54128 RepID=A0ABD2X3L5_9HYME|nr:uncharacterized protein C14orf119 homolog isoform X1 [Trichogramma pretiosum]XP_014226527.1 uncharacterized protein C14orf119 homolog isoform X1 [Trichogramma pretiosum]
MSTSLSNQAQIRYVIEWFQEWSEMQRDDFLGILMERCSNPGLVNGLLSGLENLGKDDSNRPPSLFQCRIKLFREWSHNWSDAEKETIVMSIKNIDPKFAEKYEKRLNEGKNGEHHADNAENHVEA